MPRRSPLSATERASLLAPPDTNDDMARHYAFSDGDLAVIRRRRGDANRLGIAVQLCLLRFPGQGLQTDTTVPTSILEWTGRVLGINPACWPQYAERSATRREHLLELRTYLGLQAFSLGHRQQAVRSATDLAWQTDKGVILAAHEA
jgi:TnpA family transposase